MGVGKRIVHAWIITTIPAAAAIAALSLTIIRIISG